MSRLTICCCPFRQAPSPSTSRPWLPPHHRARGQWSLPRRHRDPPPRCVLSTPGILPLTTGRPFPSLPPPSPRRPLPRRPLLHPSAALPWTLEESKQLARRGRNEHKSKQEGLATGVGCACNGSAAGEPQPAFPNRETRLAGCVYSEHVLPPAETEIDSDLGRAG